MMAYHQKSSIVYHTWPFWLSTQYCGVKCDGREVFTCIWQAMPALE